MIDPFVLQQKIKDIVEVVYRHYDHVVLQQLFVRYSLQLRQHQSMSIDVYKHSAESQKVYEPLVYCVMGVDGSQIYPDRHRGSSYFLIQAAVTIFMYQKIESQAHFLSDCFVYAGLYERAVIDRLREYHEYSYVLDQLKAQRIDQWYCMVDGMQKEDDGDVFIDGKLFDSGKKYQELINWCVDTKSIVVHYTSLPASRDLIACIQALEAQELAGLHDGSWLAYCLQPGQKTDWFIKKQKPKDGLEFIFCYWHTTFEIVRIDIPKIVFDDSDLDTFWSVMINQVAKGYGYPICLMHAHEQAVIRAADEQVFYALINQYNQQRDLYVLPSFKEQKKRTVDI